MPQVVDPPAGLDLIPITLMRCGQAARVDQVVGRGELVRRLCELGIRAGVRVEMIRCGTPCLIRIEGVKLGLRADELVGVLVQLERGAVA